MAYEREKDILCKDNSATDTRLCFMPHDATVGKHRNNGDRSNRLHANSCTVEQIQTGDDRYERDEEFYCSWRNLDIW